MSEIVIAREVELHLARAAREIAMANRAKHASARLAHHNLADMHRRAAERAGAPD